MSPVSPAKMKALEERMAALGVAEEEIEESFIRSSGPGGQHTNKASTAVSLLHRPTGLRVKCGSARSQALNRLLARRRLLDLIEKAATGRIAAEEAERERIRRRKRKRSRRAKEKMLEEKRRRGETKRLRARVRPGEEP